MTFDADEHERRCLELAWRSCRSGTIGVGAVLVDTNGQVMAEGNNAIYAPADVGPLENSRIAHAEMNVFAQIPGGGGGAEGATLYTSLEPCAMCAGAILMHELARVRVLAPDPLMHDLAAMGDRNPWVQARWAPRDFATDDTVVRFALLFAMHSAFFWFDETHPLVARVMTSEPDRAAWIRAIASERRLTALAAAGADLDDVMDALG